jgi:tRNA threonylcarbamoyladenosine biosynthesis protein TsaB
LENDLSARARGGRTLAIESAGELAGVAVDQDGRLIGEAAIETRHARTELICDLARRLLDDLGGLAVSDCDRISCSDGPGSFTGLRVGMAAAIGLAMGANLPLVVVPTLEVHAWPWREIGDPIVVLSGRRRGQVYAACFVWGSERFASVLDPASRGEAEVFALLPGLPGGRLLFVGDAIDSLAEPIRAVMGVRAALVPSGSPRAAAVARLATDPARPEWVGVELEGRTPRYMREADARRPQKRR